MTSTPSPKAAPVSQGVPDRWKLVPIEPTPEMYIKGGIAIVDAKPDAETYADEACAAYSAMLSEAPSLDAAVPASGGVEAAEQVRYHWEVIQGQCSEGDGFTERAATDLELAITALEASLSPAPTSGSEAGAFDPRDDFEIWADADHRDTAALEFEERDPDNFLFYAADGTNQAYVGWYFATKAALAKPASEPAGGGVREIVKGVLRDYRMSNMRDDIGGAYPLVDLMSNDGQSIATGEAEMEMLADEIAFALSSAPAAPSSAEAEAKEGRS